eukprot:5504286-Pyramimonas_sp.AAC.1
MDFLVCLDASVLREGGGCLCSLASAPWVRVLCTLAAARAWLALVFVSWLGAHGRCVRPLRSVIARQLGWARWPRHFALRAP